MSDLEIDKSSAQKLGPLNGFFISSGVKDMLDSNDYTGVDMIFPLIAAFIDRVIATEMNQSFPLLMQCI